MSQSQQVGLQSAKVEQAAPAERVPFNFCGLDGQPPFTCSACEETFVDEDDPDEDEEEEDEEPEGELGSELPVMSEPLVPPEQATRTKSEDEATSEPSFMRAARATLVPRAERARSPANPALFVVVRASARATVAQAVAPALTRQRRALRRRA